MTKKIISVRLSDERLTILDQECGRLGISRSEGIDLALKIWPALLAGTAETQYHPENRRIGKLNPAK